MNQQPIDQLIEDFDLEAEYLIDVIKGKTLVKGFTVDGQQHYQTFDEWKRNKQFAKFAHNLAKTSGWDVVNFTGEQK